jgi:hypothetical protein
MNETLPALPKDWIRRIFMRFEVVYGPALMAGTWGTGDKTMIIDGWAEELAAFKDHPNAIKYALESLPIDYPPNLLQFKEICREGMRRQQASAIGLTYKTSPEEREANRKNIERIKEMINGTDRTW